MTAGIGVHRIRPLAVVNGIDAKDADEVKEKLCRELGDKSKRATLHDLVKLRDEYYRVLDNTKPTGARRLLDVLISALGSESQGVARPLPKQSKPTKATTDATQTPPEDAVARAHELIAALARGRAASEQGHRPRMLKLPPVDSYTCVLGNVRNDTLGSIAFSTDGSLLALVAEGSNQPPKVETIAGAEPVQLEPIPLRLESWDGTFGLRFAGNDKVVMGYAANNSRHLWVWKLGSDASPQDLCQGVNEFAVDGAGTRVAVVGDGSHEVRLFDLSTRSELEPIVLTGEREDCGVQFSNGGTQLLVINRPGLGGSTLEMFDLDTRSVLETNFEIPEDRLMPKGRAVLDTVVFGENDSLLVGVTSTGRILRWDVKTGRLSSDPPQNAENESERVKGLAMRRDGKVFATLDSSGTVRIYETASGNPIGDAIQVPADSQELFESLQFSSDGKKLYWTGRGCGGEIEFDG